MGFVATALLLILVAPAVDRWRDERRANRWIDETFGKNISPTDRLKVRRLYWGAKR